MFGLLNLRKPAGVTSRDVVNLIQRLTRPDKVGHAGTLDPLATGVLVVCVGPATRLIEYVQRMPKRYCARFLLGRESDTEDTEGEIVELPNARPPNVEQIQRALPSFVGQIQQLPPQYSALKVQGKRAYQLARQGIQAPLKPRNITIYGIELVEYDYPALTLRIECGSGAYIRSLGRDLGRSLQSGAVMSHLCREAVGEFVIAEAIEAGRLDQEELRRQLIPAGRAVAGLPRVELSPEQLMEVSHGRSIELARPAEVSPKIAAKSNPRGLSVAPTSPPGQCAAFAAGQLAAILHRRDDGRWGPLRNFPVSARESS